MIQRHTHFICLFISSALLSGCFQSTGDLGRRKPNAIQDSILPAVGKASAWARGQDDANLLKTDSEREYRRAAWDYLMPTKHSTNEPIPLVATGLFVLSPSVLSAAVAYGGLRSDQGQNAVASLHAELEMANILPSRANSTDQDWYYYRGMEWIRLIPPAPRREFPQNYFLALKALETGTHETRYRRLMSDIEADIARLPRFLALGKQVFSEDKIRNNAVHTLTTIENTPYKTQIPDPRIEATFVEREGTKIARIAEERMMPNTYIQRVNLRADENWHIMERVEGRYIERIEAYRYALNHLVVETPSQLAITAENLLVQLEANKALFPHRSKQGKKNIYKDTERFKAKQVIK